MAKSKESTSTQERAKHRTTGAFRCLSCFERVTPPDGAASYTCPNCGYAWRVWWFNPNEPRIRGPVWDSHEKMTQAKMKEKEGK
jgi:predicted RNA-binding Zn-ribbon protein involved in translation (DUF1610 family)